MAIRVLVVDDSALMRKLIRDILSTDTAIEVVDVAYDGKDAFEKALQLKPDVITMDVEMPNMNGIDAVKQIMTTTPTPIVMVSALTSKDADVTIDALNSGAVDFICKPSGSISTDIGKIGNEIIEKVKSASQAKVHQQKQLYSTQPSKKIGVFLIDNSPNIRKTIRESIAREKDIEVVDEANDGREALEKIPRVQPDIIISEIDSSEINGISSTLELLKKLTIPTIIFSGKTTTHMKEIKLALELGAIDFIPKPAPQAPIHPLASLLIKKIRDVSKQTNSKKVTNSGVIQTENILVIGTSTGGPQTLAKLIPQIPADIPAGVLIIQHMPPVFTQSLANRLNTLSQIPVREAQDGDEILVGEALLAPGDFHMTISERKTGGSIKRFVTLNKEEKIHGVRPAVDITFSSAANVYGSRTVGVLLTGMGQDGAQAMGLIKAKGGYTIAQDQQTSIIFGMPDAAIKLGVVDLVLPLDAIAQEAVRLLRTVNKKEGVKNG